MMNETIIKSALKNLVKMQIEEGSVGFAIDNDPDHDCCWDDVLAWLEVQSCEDCISRQAVIEWLKDKDIIKTKNQEENIRKELTELPQRPRGEWIKVNDEKPIAYDCSECGSMVSKKYNYCPNCGADMRGKEK